MHQAAGINKGSLFYEADEEMIAFAEYVQKVKSARATTASVLATAKDPVAAPAKDPVAAPAKDPDAPAKDPVAAPAKDPDAPAKAPDAPAKAPDAPAKAPDAPAKAPDAPAKADAPAPEIDRRASRTKVEAAMKEVKLPEGLSLKIVDQTPNPQSPK